jgi:hypothetical protein
MAARKRSRRGNVSSFGKTIESSMVELRKSLDTLRRMLEGYLPSGGRRRRSKTAARRTATRRSRRAGARRGKRAKRVA